MQTPTDSPIQIGTQGSFRGRAFRVIELFRKWTNQESWNEWQIQFESQEKAWIKESQGTWFLFQFLPEALIENQALSAGEEIAFQENKFVVRKIHKLSFEINGRIHHSTLFDLASGPVLLNIEDLEGQRLISQGEKIEFKELKAQNLRPLDAGHRIQKISCPNCHVSILIRYKSFSQRAVCRSCLSLIDMSSDDLIALTQINTKFKFEPLLNIGASATLLGDTFEVIGCLRFSKSSGPITKYLMFSPYKSYRWLLEERGHWTFSRPLDDPPSIDMPKVSYRKQNYKFSQTSELFLEFAIGEFFWPLAKNESLTTQEFIAPPFLLSFETRHSDMQVYLGRYISSRQVRSAFNLVHSLPEAEGIIAHEASPFHHYLKEFFVLNLIFLIVCFFIQIRNNQVPEKSVHESHITSSNESSESLQSTEPFEVRGGPSALAIAIQSSPIRKLEVDLSEIRSKTKYSLQTKTDKSEFLISSIPSGVYFLSFRPPEPSPRHETYNIQVFYGKKSWSNFLLAAILISLPTLFIFVLDLLFLMNKSKRGQIAK